MKTLLFLVVIATHLSSIKSAPHFQASRIGYARNIRPNKCTDKTGLKQGTCMFAWDCFNSNGTHLGTCVDRFYFGSCCRPNPHNSSPYLEISNSIEPIEDEAISFDVHSAEFAEQSDNNGGSKTPEHEYETAQNVEDSIKETISIQNLNDDNIHQPISTIEIISPTALNENLPPIDFATGESPLFEVVGGEITPVETVGAEISSGLAESGEAIPVNPVDGESSPFESLNGEMIPIHIPEGDVHVGNELEETGGGYEVIYFPDAIPDLNNINTDKIQNDDETIDLSNMAIINLTPDLIPDVTEVKPFDSIINTEGSSPIHETNFINTETRPSLETESNLPDNMFPNRLPDKTHIPEVNNNIIDEPIQKPIIFMDSVTSQSASDLSGNKEEIENDSITTIGETEIDSLATQPIVAIDEKPPSDSQIMHDVEIAQPDISTLEEIENVINIILNEQNIVNSQSDLNSEDNTESKPIIFPSIQVAGTEISTKLPFSTTIMTEVTETTDDGGSQIHPEITEDSSALADIAEIQGISGIVDLSTLNPLSGDNNYESNSTRITLLTTPLNNVEESLETSTSIYVEDQQTEEVAIGNLEDSQLETTTSTLVDQLVDIDSSSNIADTPLEEVSIDEETVEQSTLANAEEQSIETTTNLNIEEESADTVIHHSIEEDTITGIKEPTVQIISNSSNNTKPIEPTAVDKEPVRVTTASNIENEIVLASTISNVNEEISESSTQSKINESLAITTDPTVYPPTVVPSSESVTNTSETFSPEEQERLLLSKLSTANYKDVCGTTVYPVSRIVGGNEATYGEWPWQVSLRQRRNIAFLHKCGAALVNENWVITAAHCVEGIEPEELLVVIGEYDLGTATEPYPHVERGVQVIAMHPKFEPRTFEYDLALLRMPEPITFKPNIIPICIPGDDYNFLNETGFVTGWGRLYEDGPLPTVMQKVPVPVIPNANCEGMYRDAGYIEDIPHIFICAGYELGKQDSCEGDSGGPLVIHHKDRWNLAGIISWGIGCAVQNQPGVYTRISEFREWINKIIVF